METTRVYKTSINHDYYAKSGESLRAWRERERERERGRERERESESE